MPDDRTARVQDLLGQMPQRGLEAAKQLLWPELDYDRANKPLPVATLTASEQAYLHATLTILSQAGVGPAPMRIIHVTLSPEARGRG